MQVEFSLISAIFVGACMIEGTIIDGFKTTLEEFLLGAVADVGHGYVVLFSLFLSYVPSSPRSVHHHAETSQIKGVSVGDF